MAPVVLSSPLLETDGRGSATHRRRGRTRGRRSDCPRSHRGTRSWPRRLGRWADPGHLLAPSKGECLAVAWDLATGRERCRIPLGPGIGKRSRCHRTARVPPCWAALPRWPASDDLPTVARIIDLNTGSSRLVVRGPSGIVVLRGITFDHDGRHVVVPAGAAMTSDDWAVVWYDAATMKETARLPIGSCHGVGGLSPDGRLVAIREQRRPGSLGNQRAGTRSVSFPWPRSSAARLPAPLYELTGSSRQFDSWNSVPMDAGCWRRETACVRLWDTASGAEVLSIRLQGSLSLCQFSPFLQPRRPQDLGRPR